jgi:hypothetical protein
MVAAVQACGSAGEVFDALSRFFAWLQKTRTDFRAYGARKIESTRDIVAWRAALKDAAMRRQHAGKPLDDLSYMAEVLSAAWHRLEALQQP